MTRARPAIPLLALLTLVATIACRDDAPRTIAKSHNLVEVDFAPVPSTPVGALPGAVQVGPSGDAHYAMRIEVSPGVRGMQPELAVKYNSTGGNGALGQRVALTGMSAIARCSKTIADDGVMGPVTYLPSDALCIDGERLLLAAGVHAQAGAQYRTRREPFSRIVLDNDLHVTGGKFTVHTKEGRILTYGTPDATMWLYETESSRVAWRWALAKQCDRFNNCIDYQYEHGSDLGTGPSELRLVQIRYGGTGPLASMRKINLDWEARPDAMDTWFYGAKLRLDQRIERITIEGPNAEKVRSYRFEYQVDPNSGYSQLLTAQLCDLADVCLPETRFTWEDPVGAELELHSWQNDPLETGISDAEQQMALLQTRQAAYGDFDGDGHDGLLYMGNAETGEFGLSWDGGEEVIHAPTFWGMLPGDNEAVENELDALLGDSVPAAFLHGYLHRYQPAFGMSTVDFNGDVLDDLLIPMRDGWPNDGAMADAHGHPFAVDFTIAMGGGSDAPEGGIPFQRFTTLRVDDGSNDRIYQIVPLDQDGDRFTDAWLCRGTGYKTARWVLARHVSAHGGHSFTFTDSGIGCSAHDELQVMSLRGGHHSLLVIPAYTANVAEQPDPAAMSVRDYVNNYPPLPDEQRGDYQELRIDLASRVATLVPAGLPRDIYQRLHDMRCLNGAARATYGGSLFGAGLGHDRQVDLNGDGFVDVLRFELAAGDTVGNLPAIEDGLAAFWQAGNVCGSDADLAKPAVLRPYYNTGRGFVAGSVALALPGNAHANLWLNFIGAQIYDHNADGRPELMLPGVGPGTDWTMLGSTSDGTFVTDNAPLPDGWPAYTDDDTWRDQLETFGRTRVVALDDGGDWPNLAFIGWTDDGHWPYIVNLFEAGSSQSTGRIARITDGMGMIHELDYRLVYDTVPKPSYPKTPVRGGLWTTEAHRELADPQGDFRETRYKYENAVADRLGRGFLGFEAVEAVSARNRTRTTYDTSYDASLADYPRSGHPSKRVVITSLGTVDDIKRDVWTWQTRVVPLLGKSAYFVYASVHDDQGYVVPDGACDDVECGKYLQINSYREARATETRDAYGNLLTQVKTVGDASATLTQSQITNNAAAWLIGLVGKVEVRSCRGSTAVCKTRTVVSTYDAVTGAQKTTTVMPGHATLALRSTFHLDPHGNIDMVMREAPGGVVRTSATTWDAEGVLPRVFTDELGHDSQIAYHNASGTILARIAIDGRAEKFTVDGLYRTVGRSSHSSLLGPDDGAATTIAYDLPTLSNTALTITTTIANGQQTSEHIAPTGQVVERRWIGMSDLLGDIPPEIPGGELVYQRYGYDHRGFEITKSVPQWLGLDPLGWYQHEHDNLGRIVSRTAPDGVVLETKTYLSIGEQNLMRVTSHTTQGADQLTTSIDTAADGLPFKTTDASGVETRFTYGPFDQQKQIVVGGITVSSTTYDDLGHVWMQSDRSLGARTSTWNAFGELVKHIDADARETTYQYDPLGRMILRTDPDGETEFEWDIAHPTVMKSTTSTDGVTETYDIDSFARVFKSTTVVPSSSGADSYVVTTDYGPGGRVSQITYPSPDGEPFSAVTYSYDAAGYQRAARDAATGELRYVVRQANPSALPRLEEYGNGVTTDRTYNELRLWPTDIATHNAAGTELQLLHYTWLPEGELQERRDNAPVTDQIETFQYDAQWRLTASTVNNGTPVTVGYDDVGNITSKSDVGAYTYGSGRPTTIGGETVLHDFSGNVTKHGTKQMTYTPFGKVRTITSGTQSLAFAYNGQGERVLRTDQTGAQTITIGNLYERSLSPTGTTQSITRRITAGGRVVAQDTSTRRLGGFTTVPTYLHDDQLGSTHVTTNSIGTQVNAVTYDPWGRARSATNWQQFLSDADAAKPGIGFTGHRAQLDQGFIDMGGRIYDPRIARFTSPDPVTSEPLGSQGHGRYSYVGNRPLRFTDPSGWAAEPGSSDSDFADDTQSSRLAEFMGLADAALARVSARLMDQYHDTAAMIENMDAEWAQGVVESTWSSLSSLTFEDALRAYASFHAAAVGRFASNLDERIEMVFAIVDAVRTNPTLFFEGMAVDAVEGIKHDIHVVTHAHYDALKAAAHGDFEAAYEHLAAGHQSMENLVSMFVTGGGSKAVKTVEHAGKKAVAKRVAAAARTIDYHHLLPRQFNWFFAKRGLNVDFRTVALSPADHKKIHGGWNRWSDGWNARWKKWIKAHPDADYGDILEQMEVMRHEFGIDHLPIVTFPR